MFGVPSRNGDTWSADRFEDFLRLEMAVPLRIDGDFTFETGPMVLTMPDQIAAVGRHGELRLPEYSITTRARTSCASSYQAPDDLFCV